MSLQCGNCLFCLFYEGLLGTCNKMTHRLKVMRLRLTRRCEVGTGLNGWCSRGFNQEAADCCQLCHPRRWRGTFVSWGGWALRGRWDQNWAPCSGIQCHFLIVQRSRCCVVLLEWPVNSFAEFNNSKFVMESFTSFYFWQLPGLESEQTLYVATISKNFNFCGNPQLPVCPSKRGYRGFRKKKLK